MVSTLGKPSPYGDAIPRYTWLNRGSHATEFARFVSRLKHHADIWPILGCVGFAFGVGLYTGWETLTRNPDVQVRHDWTKPDADVQPTVDFADRMADQAVAAHDKSLFAKYARLRHTNQAGVAGAGWDTRLLYDPMETTDRTVTDMKKAAKALHEEKQ